MLVGAGFMSATLGILPKEFVPEAKLEDWRLEHAGQRVQVIKKDPKHGGILQFGTEVICAADGSLSALLGASPGASTSVSIMLTLLGNCFSEKMASQQWKAKLEEMIPSCGRSLSEDAELHASISEWTHSALRLKESASAC